MFTPIIGAKLLLILWLIGYNKFFDLKSCLVLSLIDIYLIFSQLQDFTTIIMIISIYYWLEVLFSYLKLRKLFLSLIYITLQNICAILISIIGRDIPFFVISKVYTFSQTIPSPRFYILQLLILFFILVILRKIEKSYSLWKSLLEFSLPSNFFSAIMLIINFILVFLREFLINSQRFQGYFYTNTIFFAISFPLIIISYYIVKNFKQKRKIDNLIRTASTNQQLNATLKEFQHDYKTLIMGIQGYLINEDLIGLQEYLERMKTYSSTILSEDLKIQIQSITNLAIQGVLYAFIESCQQKNIKLILNITDDLPIQTIEIYDFIRCLSIILNNSIEHSSGKIYLGISKEEDTTRLILKNSIKKKADITQLFKKNYTTKEGHSGIGLSIFSKLISKYPNISYYVDSTNEWLTFGIIIS